MKKTRLLLLVFAWVFLLTACTAVNLDEYTYTRELRGVTYTIDPKAQTVTDGENVYQFTKTETAVTIIYPNGAEYTEAVGDRYSTSSWKGGKPAGSPEGWELVNMVMPTGSAPKKANTELVIMGLVALLVGVFNAIFPKIAWFIRYGWTFKNPEYAEPSDGMVLFGRIVGVGFAILGVVAIIAGFSG